MSKSRHFGKEIPKDVKVSIATICDKIDADCAAGSRSKDTHWYNLSLCLILTLVVTVGLVSVLGIVKFNDKVRSIENKIKLSGGVSDTYCSPDGKLLTLHNFTDVNMKLDYPGTKVIGPNGFQLSCGVSVSEATGP